MTENEKQETQEETQDKPLEWWKQFEGKPVVIQLRPGAEYVGVTYPNQPFISQDPETGKLNVGSIPVLRGELQTRGSGADLRLAVLTGDPDAAKPTVRFEVLLHPDDTLYVTVLQQGVVAV